MSPGRMTVQGMMPAIFLPGPGQTQDGAGQDALAGRTLDRRAGRLVGLRVVEHHQRRSDGLAVAHACISSPGCRPVIPATLMIAALAGLPGIVGSTISLAVQPMCVRSPW